MVSCNHWWIVCFSLGVWSETPDEISFGYWIPIHFSRVLERQRSAGVRPRKGWQRCGGVTQAQMPFLVRDCIWASLRWKTMQFPNFAKHCNPYKMNLPCLSWTNHEMKLPCLSIIHVIGQLQLIGFFTPVHVTFKTNLVVILLQFLPYK